MVADIDAAFSKIFRFKFEPLKKFRTLVEQAYNLLERMPPWPLELMDTPIVIPLEYYASSVVENAPQDAPPWEELQATTYVSSTVLRVALLAVMDQGIGNFPMDMINIIASLLEIVSRLSPIIKNASTL